MADIDLRPILDQELHHQRIALSGGFHKRSLAPGRSDIRARTGLQQQTSDVNPATGHSRVKGGVVYPIAYIEGGSCFYQLTVQTQ